MIKVEKKGEERRDLEVDSVKANNDLLTCCDAFALEE